VRWEAGLEEGAREPPGRSRWEMAGRWGTAGASVLGDLAVVFRMDVPAQTDGQKHPQELEGEVESQGEAGLPAPKPLPAIQVNSQTSIWITGSSTCAS
jgi:hypothetical protein